MHIFDMIYRPMFASFIGQAPYVDILYDSLYSGTSFLGSFASLASSNVSVDW